MAAIEDLTLTDPGDPRTQAVVEALATEYRNVAEIDAALQLAGLKPQDYTLSPAILAWTEIVADAARTPPRLQALIRNATHRSPAFLSALAQTLETLERGTDTARPWYFSPDPYGSSFVGTGGRRAIVDRLTLRSSLKLLADDQYRILLIKGASRSGKSHTWVLVDHLRSAGTLAGTHRFTRVTTHDWSGEVTGEALAGALADKLGFNLALTASAESDEARMRKAANQLVGLYPQTDVAVRWIVLDGLDRPGVLESARDFARRLVALVDAGELSRTRLIVTGLDELGLEVGPSVCEEQIPGIDQALVRTFLTDVADQLNRHVTDVELKNMVAEVLGPAAPWPDLRTVERALHDVVMRRWVGAGHGDQ